MKISVKRLLTTLLLAILLTGATATVMPAMAATIKTRSIVLDRKGTVAINIGTTLDLTATVTPATSTQGVKWTSSKRSVATVAGGKVTARKAGVTVITAKSGVRKATVRIKVVDPYLPTSVRLDKTGTVRIPLYSTLTLNATLSPATAKSGLSWKSSSKKVATVSNGVITARKAGTATITVTTRNKKKARMKVKVYDPYLPTSVKLDKSGTVKVPIGSTLTLTPTLNPSTAKSGFTWKSSKKKVATVSNGVVTAKKVGVATIMVTTRNKKKSKVKVSVYDPYLPTSVTLNKSGTVSAAIGTTVNLAATMSPSTAVSGLTWKSSKPKIVSVNAKGIAVPLRAGTATITVTTRNKKTAKVKIKSVETNNEPITTPAGYNLPYVIYVSKKTHTVAILARDGSGAWNRVIHKYPTGLGVNNSTTTGVYTLTAKEYWHSWGGGYSPYCNKLSCGIFLHGPIYSSKNFKTIKVSYYNHIGTDTSSGCIRTICGCAAWVYYNCPIGTQIIIRDNSRFSEPKQAKLSSGALSDPTDPGSNPEMPITSFKASPAAITLEQGKSQAIGLTGIEPANNSTGNQFTYSTGNAAIATVSASGVVTGVAPGVTNITIVAKDAFKATLKVPVTVTTVSLAAAEAVTTEKLLEDDTPAGTDEVPASDEVSAEAVEAPASDVVPAEAVEAPASEEEHTEVDEAPAQETVIGETAEEANADETAEVIAPSEEIVEATDPIEEELISGTETELPAEAEETVEEDNGLAIETEELAEEQYDIIIEEE